MPQVGQDLFRRALRVRFQLEQEIAVVGLGDEKPQLGARPAGIAFQLGCRQDDVLGVFELAIGLGQAGARRGQVVDDEPAFVHGRQEFALQLGVKEDAQNQDDGAGGDRPAAVPQGGADYRLVDADDPPQEEPALLSRRGRFFLLARADEPAGQGRRQGHG